MKIIRSIAALLFTVLLLAGCGAKPSGPSAEQTSLPEETTSLLYQDLSGFAVGSPFAYTGAYVEDGSGDALENVAAVRIENVSEEAIRSVQFTMDTGAGELRFVCTTLLPGRSALLLEQDRRPYTGARVNGITVDDKIVFTEPLSLYPDTFRLSVADQVMTLKNISSAPVAGNIFVYFKRCDAQGYVGGITYRIRFADLPAGAEASMRAQNLNEKDCDILFIGCENPPEVQP